MPKRTLCSSCQEPSREKMAGFYWAWTWPTGDRRAYKQFFDFECATPVLRDLVRVERHPDECLQCGIMPSTSEGEVLVWCTYYLPGKERQDACLPFHPACFEGRADRFSHNAVRLADKGVGGGGTPSPNPGNRWDSWASMGIEPL